MAEPNENIDIALANKWMRKIIPSLSNSALKYMYILFFQNEVPFFTTNPGYNGVVETTRNTIPLENPGGE